MTRVKAVAATLLALVIVLASVSISEYSMLGAQKALTTTVTSSTTATTTVTATTLSVSGAGDFSPNVIVYLQGISHWETQISPSILDSYWYYRGGFQGISPGGSSDCLGCVDFPLGTNFTVDATYGVLPTSWYRSGSVNITTVRVDSIALYPKGVFTIVGANATWPFVVSSNNATITVALSIMCPNRDYAGVLAIDSNMTALAEYTGIPTNST